MSNDANKGQASPIEAAANKLKKKDRESLGAKTETKLVEAKKLRAALHNLVETIVEDHEAVGITVTAEDVFKIVSDL